MNFLDNNTGPKDFIHVIDKNNKKEKLRYTVTRTKEEQKQQLLRRITPEKFTKVKYLLEKHFPGYPYQDRKKFYI